MLSNTLRTRNLYSTTFVLFLGCLGSTGLQPLVKMVHAAANVVAIRTSGMPAKPITQKKRILRQAIRQVEGLIPDETPVCCRYPRRLLGLVCVGAAVKSLTKRNNTSVECVGSQTTVAHSRTGRLKSGIPK